MGCGIRSTRKRGSRRGRLVPLECLLFATASFFVILFIEIFLVFFLQVLLLFLVLTFNVTRPGSHSLIPVHILFVPLSIHGCTVFVRSLLLCGQVSPQFTQLGTKFAKGQIRTFFLELRSPLLAKDHVGVGSPLRSIRVFPLLACRFSSRRVGPLTSVTNNRELHNDVAFGTLDCEGGWRVRKQSPATDTVDVVSLWGRRVHCVGTFWALNISGIRGV
mmetsp:Transcript_33818/g.66528  ORF Transcript_33818/g.66528 Transcript_33818/m.66528 type:complete len:218 (+) Transcript_33818:345-998(+)